MTVYLLINGKLVEKGKYNTSVTSPDFPTPMISRAISFESPVTGKEITSWRARDADMKAAGACDPSDLPRKPFEEREKMNAQLRDKPAEWGYPAGWSGTGTPLVARNRRGRL
jgi:hypothetical protein